MHGSWNLVTKYMTFIGHTKMRYDRSLPDSFYLCTVYNSYIMKKYLQFPLYLSLMLTGAPVRASDDNTPITILARTPPEEYEIVEYKIEELTPNSTVSDLKWWLYEKKGMHPITQVLIYSAKQLGGRNGEKDTWTLKDCGVQNMSRIHILIYMRYVITLDRGDGKEKIVTKEFNGLQKIAYVKKTLDLKERTPLFYEDKELENTDKLSEVNGVFGQISRALIKL